jgi:hypothetical protein
MKPWMPWKNICIVMTFTRLEAQRLLEVTYRSTQNNVERLVHAGILQPMGDVSYDKTYLATEIMDIIVDKDRTV